MTMEDQQILIPCTAARSLNSSSPEFEFWKVCDTSFPQPNLLSADQLFSGGFLLPLEKLKLSDEPPPLPPPKEQQPLQPESADADLSSATATLSSSKRWRQIFKKSEKKSLDFDGPSPKEKDVAGCKERRKKISGVSVGISVSSAELNINLWPFSRSRSAGTNGGRPRATAPPRKVSSAPCSRSNSTGESNAKKLPAHSQTTVSGGVHLGRNSPILKVRRAGQRNTHSGKSSENSSTDKRHSKSTTGSRTKVLNLNVPMCIGYRPQVSCSREENSPIVAGDGATEGAGEELPRNNLLSIRNLFSKKVY